MNNKRQKDQEMAQRLKAIGDERWTGRCPTCYRLIPNGLFAEGRHYAHVINCPGPEKRSGSNGHSAFGGPRS